jgi:hypothetical protein
MWGQAVTEMTVESRGKFEYDLSDPKVYTEDDILNSRKYYIELKGNRHAWVVALTYEVEDPDVGVNGLDLGLEQLIGTSEILCLYCRNVYTPEIKDQECPEPLPTTDTLSSEPE